MEVFPIIQKLRASRPRANEAQAEREPVNGLTLF